MKIRSSGFTLIELLVVVAILGILAAVGITSYSGYVSSTKMKSTENIMRQIALGQTEYYSENSTYFGGSSSSCTPSIKTSESIEEKLLGGAKVIIDPNKTPKETTSGYNICVADHATNFQVYAVEVDDDKPCKITLYANNELKRDTNCK